jgi:hypothetical protein
MKKSIKELDLMLVTGKDNYQYLVSETEEIKENTKSIIEGFNGDWFYNSMYKSKIIASDNPKLDSLPKLIFANNNPYTEICDKLGNPIDAIDCNVSFLKKQIENPILDEIDNLIEKVKNIFHEFRQKWYQEEDKKFTSKEITSLVAAVNTHWQTKKYPFTLPMINNHLNLLKEKNYTPEIDIDEINEESSGTTPSLVQPQINSKNQIIIYSA